MRRLLVAKLALVAVIASVLVQAQSSTQPDVVTNQTVIEMVKAKLPADVIITKIQTSQTNFDLSTAALVKLNENSVPSDVIKAMMQKSATPTVQTIAATAPSTIKN